MNNGYKSDTRNRKEWAVTIYENQDSSEFYAKCVSPTGKILSTEVCKNKESAWQAGYDLVDKEIMRERADRYNAIALPLTLALLYVSGNDEYLEGYKGQRDFIGRSSWKGYGFGILDLLEEQGLIRKRSSGAQSVFLTNEGIKKARNTLRNLNLEVEEFLQTHAEHDNLPEINQ